MAQFDLEHDGTPWWSPLMSTPQTPSPRVKLRSFSRKLVSPSGREAITFIVQENLASVTSYALHEDLTQTPAARSHSRQKKYQPDQFDLAVCDIQSAINDAKALGWVAPASPAQRLNQARAQQQQAQQTQHPATSWGPAPPRSQRQPQVCACCAGGHLTAACLCHKCVCVHCGSKQHSSAMHTAPPPRCSQCGSQRHQTSAHPCVYCGLTSHPSSYHVVSAGGGGGGGAAGVASSVGSGTATVTTAPAHCAGCCCAARESGDQSGSVFGTLEEAAEQIVRSGFRALSMRHHPDKGGDPATMAVLTEARGQLKQMLDLIKR